MDLDDPRWSELEGGYRVPLEHARLLLEFDEEEIKTFELPT